LAWSRSPSFLVPGVGVGVWSPKFSNPEVGVGVPQKQGLRIPDEDTKAASDTAAAYIVVRWRKLTKYSSTTVLFTCNEVTFSPIIGTFTTLLCKIRRALQVTFSNKPRLRQLVGDASVVRFSIAMYCACDVF